MTTTISTMTKQEILKVALIARFIDLVNEKINDIETGIEEGLYDREENAETLASLEEDLKLAEELTKAKSEIYAYISGGVLQGISATCKMGVNLFDHDNYDAGDTDTTPEEWEADIERMTADNEITGVY